MKTITVSSDVLQQALRALELTYNVTGNHCDSQWQAIVALREALVPGPRYGASERFAKWFNSENFDGLPAVEIASLGFDAGHAFWHKEISGEVVDH